MKTISLLFTITHLISVNLSAQPGTLDSSFGINGKDTTINRNTNIGKSLGLQKDGKIVLAGGKDNFICVRYNTNGSIDTSYGDEGIAKFTFKHFGSICNAAIMQSDEKMVLTGFVDSNGIREDFQVQRVTTTGESDSTFNGTGQLSTYIGPKGCQAYAIGLQSDEKIIVGGFSYNNFDKKTFTLVRYLQNGIVDSTFGGVGIILTPNGNSGSDSYFNSLAVQNDDKIVAIGLGHDDINFGTTIIRYQKNGVLDTSFGINGFVFTNIYPVANALNLQSDGKILLASNDESGNIYLWRYLSNGNIDSSFGINGKQITSLNGRYTYINSIITQSDNKIVISGNISNPNSGNYWDFGIIRYLKNGLLDSSFGINGVVVTDFYGYSDEPSAIALQKDGKILQAGTSYYPAKKENVFALVRYNNDGPIIGLKKNISSNEGNIGLVPVQFKVTISNPYEKDIFINYGTKNLTALAGLDYINTSGTLRIKAGKKTGNITVNIIGDNEAERNEKFSFVLSNPVNAILGGLDSAICTIKNDDPLFVSNGSTEEHIKANETSIKVYPNPAKETLRIQGLNAGGKTTISILDMQGNAVIKTTTGNSNFTVNVKNLAPGTYYANIDSGIKTETIKFIKE